MNSRRKRWSVATALAAACLLVLQSVLGAYALGASPNPALLDVFGNVICAERGAAEHPSNTPHGGHLPDCCTLGCNLAAVGLASPPNMPAFARAFVFDALGFGIKAQHFIFASRDRSPANPRAPPLPV